MQDKNIVRIVPPARPGPPLLACLSEPGRRHAPPQAAVFGDPQVAGRAPYTFGPLIRGFGEGVGVSTGCAASAAAKVQTRARMSMSVM